MLTALPSPVCSNTLPVHVRNGRRMGPRAVSARQVEAPDLDDQLRLDHGEGHVRTTDFEVIGLHLRAPELP